MPPPEPVTARQQLQAVTIGQMHFGQIGFDSKGKWTPDIWRLPPLLVQDRVTVAATASANFALGGNVDDFNWLHPWGNLSDSYSVYQGESRRIALNAEASCSECFLEVGQPGPAGDFGPYSFTVESIQHALGLGLAPVSSVKRKGESKPPPHLLMAPQSKMDWMSL